MAILTSDPCRPAPEFLIMACSFAPAGMGQVFDVQFSPMRPIRLTLIMYLFF